MSPDVPRKGTDKEWNSNFSAFMNRVLKEALKDYLDVVDVLFLGLEDQNVIQVNEYVSVQHVPQPVLNRA